MEKTEKVRLVTQDYVCNDLVNRTPRTSFQKIVTKYKPKYFTKWSILLLPVESCKILHVYHSYNKLKFSEENICGWNLTNLMIFHSH